MEHSTIIGMDIAKRDMQNIWMSATRAEAEVAFDAFETTYEDKFPGAVVCRVKDRDSLMTF